MRLHRPISPGIRSRLTLKLLRYGVLLSVACAASAAAQQGVVRFVNILELSGPGSSAGTSMENGVELAIAEINAKGGILGQRIEVESFDTQTSASIALALAQRAVDEGAYTIIGPVFSGSIIAIMNVVRSAQIPTFTGAAASSVTEQHNPFVFRIGLSQSNSIPKIVRYLSEVSKVKQLALVWMHNDFGKGGRDVLLRELSARNINVVADLPIEQGQIDFASEVNRLKAARAEALFVYLNEEESARLLRELRKRSYPGLVAGDGTIVGQKTIELAGDASDGVLGQVTFTGDAPDALTKLFVTRFETRYGAKPDHNAIAGYMTPYIIKVITERIGRFDRKAFAEAMKGAILSAKEEPGLLSDVRYDDKGEPDRRTWIVRVHNGRQIIVATIDPRS